jgi:hypothetical protein
MLAHCSSHAFEFRLLFMLELRLFFLLLVTHTATHLERKMRESPLQEVMFRLVLESAFLHVFFEREIAGHLICCFCFSVFNIHDIKACSFGSFFFV